MADLLLVSIREDQAAADALGKVFSRAGLSVVDARTADPALGEAAAVVLFVWSDRAAQSNAMLDAVANTMRSGRALIAQFTRRPVPLSVREAPTFDLGLWSGMPDDPVIDGLFVAVERLVSRAREAQRFQSEPKRPLSADGLEEEASLWRSIRDSRRPADFKAYLERYGAEGAFAELAIARLKELGAAAVNAPIQRTGAAWTSWVGPDGRTEERREVRPPEPRPEPRAPAPRQSPQGDPRNSNIHPFPNTAPSRGGDDPPPPRMLREEPPPSRAPPAARPAPTPRPAPRIETPPTDVAPSAPPKRGGFTILHGAVAVGALIGLVMAGMNFLPRGGDETRVAQSGLGSDAPTDAPARFDQAPSDPLGAPVGSGAANARPEAAAPRAAAPSTALSQPRTAPPPRQVSASATGPNDAYRPPAAPPNAPAASAPAPAASTPVSIVTPLPPASPAPSITTVDPGPADLSSAVPPSPAPTAATMPTASLEPPITTPAPATNAAPAGRVVWRERPSAAALARTFPTRAARDNVGGRAVLRCSVTGALALSCRVLSEDPAGMGFGAAAMRIVEGYKPAATLSNGASAVGAQVDIPIRYNATR